MRNRCGLRDGESIDERKRLLRSRWRTASLAAGWPFPNDWASVAVDELCDAVITDGDVLTRMSEFGVARAEAGVGLDGTLRDLAALHAVTRVEHHDGLVSCDPDAVPTHMIRCTALGWAEALAQQTVDSEVRDPLTGLTTGSYLRTRLHEIYRHARADGSPPGDAHALLSVSLDVRDEDGGFPKMMAMVLAGDALRSVFDAGETVSVLHSRTAVVLAPRDAMLRTKAACARTLIAERLLADPALRLEGPIRIEEQPLPPEHTQACELLAKLA